MTVAELAQKLDSTVPEIIEHYKKIFVDIPEDKNFILSNDLIMMARPYKNTDNYKIVNSKKSVGKIICLIGSFGFIEPETGESIYFHESTFIDTNIHLLDKVSFRIRKSKKTKHLGENEAEQIELLQKANLNDEDRFVGELKDWDGIKGVISSGQIDTPIFFYGTRKYFKEEKINKGDLLVFCPVKSSKHNGELFALFAYKLENERDNVFLHKQYKDSKIEGIYLQLKNSYKETDLSIDKKFELELMGIPYVSNGFSYSKLKSILIEYKKLNYIPNFKIIKEYCDTTYLIQLFENGLVNDYDLALMTNYFHYTFADNKRFLISKFSFQDQSHILQYHIEKLRSERKLSYLNDSIRTLLDIVYRNKETRRIDIYQELFVEVTNQLNITEIVNLWLNGYLEVPESYLIKNIDFENEVLLSAILEQKDPKFNETITRLIEEYFSIFKHKEFELEYPFLIDRLLTFEKKNKELIKEIVLTISKQLNDYQKFTLSIFGIKIDNFDLYSYINDNIYVINDYYKIKYILGLRNENKSTANLSAIKDSISKTGLVSYIKTNPWNFIVKPSGEYYNDNSKSYFLFDIEEFCKINLDFNIDIRNLANEIFEAIPIYNVEHIRLWLNGYVGNDKYDYYGFKNCFRELTISEQKKFKKNGELYSKREVINNSSKVVKPCDNITNETNLYKIYSARLCNLFFEENKIKLKKKDGTYTNTFYEEYANYGYNGIPENSPLNQCEIIVKVLSNNNIAEIKGLEFIYVSIHTSRIEGTLNTVVTPKRLNVLDTVAYVEDWPLKKTLIQYLYDNQDEEFDVKYVTEPKNFFRVLDDTFYINKSQQTGLFLHKAPNDYAIIWENIDLSEGRATYVFKSTYENVNSQIEKLIKDITTISRLRSTLSTLIIDKNYELISVFKNNLGFVGSIKKKRGNNLSFEKWLTNLLLLIERETPELPTEEELEMIDNWLPYTSHRSITIKNKVNDRNRDKNRDNDRSISKEFIKKVDISKLKTVDIKMKDDDSKSDFDKSITLNDFDRKSKINIILESFNNSIQKILNFK